MIVFTGENRSTMKLIRYSLDSIVARSFREFAYMFINTLLYKNANHKGCWSFSLLSIILIERTESFH